jgi:hypothetical protein
LSDLKAFPSTGGVGIGNLDPKAFRTQFPAQVRVKRLGTAVSASLSAKDGACKDGKFAAGRPTALLSAATQWFPTHFFFSRSLCPCTIRWVHSIGAMTAAHTVELIRRLDAKLLVRLIQPQKPRAPSVPSTASSPTRVPPHGLSRTDALKMMLQVPLHPLAEESDHSCPICLDKDSSVHCSLHALLTAYTDHFACNALYIRAHTMPTPSFIRCAFSRAATGHATSVLRDGATRLS